MSETEAGLMAIAPLEGDDTIQMQPVSAPLELPRERKPTVMQAAIDEGLPGESVWETVARLVKEREELRREVETHEFAALCDIEDQLRHERSERARLEREREDLRQQVGALRRLRQMDAECLAERDEARAGMEVLARELGRATDHVAKGDSLYRQTAKERDERELVARRMYHDTAMLSDEWLALPEQYPWLKQKP